MNKIILMLSILTMMSCQDKIETPKNTKNIEYNNNLHVENIMDDVDYGLNKITLNDTTIILIYIGGGCCSMIQIK